MTGAGSDFAAPPVARSDFRSDALALLETATHAASAVEQRNGSWRLINNLIRQPELFQNCEAILDGVVNLLVRSALTSDGTFNEKLPHLLAAVGREKLIEIVEQLANFEAVRVIASLPNVLRQGVNGKGDLARQRIAALIEAAAHRLADQPTLAGEALAPASQEPIQSFRSLRLTLSFFVSEN